MKTCFATILALAALAFCPVKAAEDAAKISTEATTKTVTKNLKFSFKPNKKPFSGLKNANDPLKIAGKCKVGTKVADCVVDVNRLVVKKEAGARRMLRGDTSAARQLQAIPSEDDVICTLINIDIGVTNIDILGLVVTLPEGLPLIVTGQAGLLGEVLCGLLGGSSPLTGLITGLEDLVDNLNGLFS